MENNGQPFYKTWLTCLVFHGCLTMNNYVSGSMVDGDGSLATFFFEANNPGKDFCPVEYSLVDLYLQIETSEILIIEHTVVCQKLQNISARQNLNNSQG